MFQKGNDNMKIYNSYTDQLEEFIPKHPGKVGMYVCGPTVYNFIHIGNARPVVFFDTVRRYFEAKGYDVTFVSNFTDVDDKIIQKAIEENLSELEVSQFYINAFLSDIESLNCKTDYLKPKVTEYMQHIIDYIQTLIDKGFAYEVDGDVYFRVSKLKDYGSLSNRDVDDLISGSRVDVNELKENSLDFTLWKKTVQGLNFQSQFSQGRPGWHTECVAMIDDIFGEEIDIHGGGIDLKFPHHENEIAQAKVTHNHRVARYWMHNGRLSMKDIKMSKSLGNVVLVKDLKHKMPLRYFLLSTHYRAPLNYSEDSFAMYVKEFEKLENTYKAVFFKLDLEDAFNENVEVNNLELSSYIKDFNTNMDDDFNTANAITALQATIKLTNQNIRKPNNLELLNQAYLTLKYMIDILGLRISVNRIEKDDRIIYKNWQNARKSKNFEEADKLRKTLVEKGVL
jgi:cysteinyl-tRNA synthetase